MSVNAVPADHDQTASGQVKAVHDLMRGWYVPSVGRYWPTEQEALDNVDPSPAEQY